MIVIIGPTLKNYNEIVSSYENVNQDALKLIESGNERFGVSQLIDFVNDYIIPGIKITNHSLNGNTKKSYLKNRNSVSSLP